MNERKPISTVEDMLQRKAKLMTKISSGERLVSASSGFEELDELIGGLKEGTVSVIGSRPGVGKTGFMLNMMLNSAKNFNVPSLFVSLDFSEDFFISCMIGIESGICTKNIIEVDFEESDKEAFSKAITVINELPIYFSENVFTIQAIREVIHEMIQNHSIKVVFIDYLQLIESSNSHKYREREVSEVMRELKNIAKEFQIAIVTTSQLSRSVESRGGDKRPMLSDLRESGSIEQDADVVAFLYRPEYYGFTCWEDNTDCSGQAELIIAKNKTGELNDVRYDFIGRNVKFRERQSGSDFADDSDFSDWFEEENRYETENEPESKPYMDISEWFKNTMDDNK